MNNGSQKRSVFGVRSVGVVVKGDDFEGHSILPGWIIGVIGIGIEIRSSVNFGKIRNILRRRLVCEQPIGQNKEISTV